MRRISYFLIAFLVSSSLFASSAPVSSIIGKVQVRIAPGSISEIALKAVSEPFTDQWLEKYADSSLLFASVAAPLLKDLPLEDVLIGEERNESVTIYSQKTGAILSFSFKNGRIVSAYPGL